MLKAVAARVCNAGLACILGAALALGPLTGQARNRPFIDGAATISVAQLPLQGRETYALIFQGGPFPYDKDGTVFGNRERLLPAHKRGYYREYTVRTHRCPPSRRPAHCVWRQAPRTPDACYYTSDHYASFREIVE